MQNLLRNRNRQGYGALVLFLIVYLAALGLIFAPEGSLSGAAAPEATSEG